MKANGYHSAHTNKNQGQHTHGRFSNDGQKGGKHGAIKAKPAKEKIKNQDQMTFMKKVVNGLRQQGGRRMNMLPGSGAFH